MTAATFLIANEIVLRRAIEAVGKLQVLEPGKRWLVTIQPEARTSAMNNKLHAMCGDVAKQVTHAGIVLDTEAWKRLFVDSWARETGRDQVSFVPSLDGKSVVFLGIQTRKQGNKAIGELIEFIYAWGTEHGVRFSASGEILNR